VERKTIDGIAHLVGYHTQEFRAMSDPLERPIKCKAKNAWLGVAYYFWTEKDYAVFWGQDFKMATGSFDIYKAYLDVEKCINAVFDENGYFFFRDRIEETIEHFKKNKKPVTLDGVNRFLADNIWPELGIEGVIYDDKPINSAKYERIHSEIPDLYYKKRIQVALFDLKNIRNFEIIEEDIN
jgi:hypothetical protein